MALNVLICSKVGDAEPHQGFLYGSRVLVAHVLVEAQPSKPVPLHIFNTGNKAVIIKRGLFQPAKALPPTNTAAIPEQLGHSTVP